MLTSIDSNEELEKISIATIFFFAEWAYPSLDMLTTLEEMPETFHTIDIEAFPEFTKEMDIRAVPTLIKYRNCKRISFKVGNIDSIKVRKWLENE